MLFNFFTAFSLELLVMAVAALLLIYANREQGCCKRMAKIVGFFTLIVAFLALLCTGYHGFSEGRQCWNCDHKQMDAFPGFKGHGKGKWPKPNGTFEHPRVTPDQMTPPPGGESDQPE